MQNQIILKQIEGAIKKLLEKEIHDLISYIDARFEKVDARFEKVDDDARNYRDEVLTRMDGIVGELQTMREEKVVGGYQIEETMNDHEKRIKKLEKLQVTQ